jgi:hypothetical protein
MLDRKSELDLRNNDLGRRRLKLKWNSLHVN